MVPVTSSGKVFFKFGWSRSPTSSQTVEPVSGTPVRLLLNNSVTECLPYFRYCWSLGSMKEDKQKNDTILLFECGKKQQASTSTFYPILIYLTWCHGGFSQQGKTGQCTHWAHALALFSATKEAQSGRVHTLRRADSL